MRRRARLLGMTGGAGPRAGGIAAMWANVSVTYDDLPAPLMALLVPFMPLLELIGIWEGLSNTARWGLSCSLLFLVGFFMQANLKPGRQAMRFLLRNRGWLYRDSGQTGGPKTSSSIQIRQRVYLVSLWLLWRTIEWEKRLLCGRWRRPKTYAVQDTLPPLPVPKLRDTFRRFLDSIRPIAEAEQYEQIVQTVQALGAAGGAGERLQREIVRRARSLGTQGSWIEEWWEKEHLLRSRQPLPVFSNWYGLDRPDTPCMSQSLRAAWLIHGAVRFHRHLSREKLEPLRMMSVVPLCMQQYKRVFNTCRIPCKTRDVLTTYPCPSPYGPSTVPQIPQLRRHSNVGADSPRDGVGRVKGGGTNSAPHLAVICSAQIFTMEVQIFVRICRCVCVCICIRTYRTLLSPALLSLSLCLSLRVRVCVSR